MHQKKESKKIQSQNHQKFRSQTKILPPSSKYDTCQNQLAQILWVSCLKNIWPFHIQSWCKFEMDTQNTLLTFYAGNGKNYKVETDPLHMILLVIYSQSLLTLQSLSLGSPSNHYALSQFLFHLIDKKTCPLFLIPCSFCNQT